MSGELRQGGAGTKVRSSLRERFNKKSINSIESFVPAEKNTSLASDTLEVPLSTTKMLEQLNQARWATQRKQYEAAFARFVTRRQELYGELANYDASYIERSQPLSHKYVCYRALNEVPTHEELFQCSAFWDFDARQWRELVDCYLQHMMINTYARDGNLDKWEDESKEEMRALYGETGEAAPTREARPRKQQTEKAPPRPVVELRPPRQIAFKEEEVMDRKVLCTRAADAGLDTLDEGKEPLVLIFIGHVDSGKSTIAGSILLAAGKIAEGELARLKEEAKQQNKESWYMAYLMDCFEEEKERGKTVEMGRAEFELSRKRFTLFDCPGHRNYVQNMMAGAAQADVAALVISAKDGEFEAGFERDGQTREHAMLARAVGVSRLVIVVNKMDTVGWSEARFQGIKAKLSEFLVQNCGFLAQDIFWCAISGLHNIFVETTPEPTPAPWFTGQSLLGTFDNLPPVQRSGLSFLRVPLLDRIREDGDLFVFGKVESGTVRAGMQCVLMPQMSTFTVSAVLSVENKRVYFAGVGESVKLQVKGLDEADIRRGAVVCGTQFWPHVCVEFEVQLDVFQLQAHQTITAGFEFTLHLHTLMEDASVVKVISRIERIGASVSSVPAHLLKSGETGIVRLRVKTPICVEKFSDVPQMGRIVMRKESYTLAAGSIVRIKLINKETLKSNYFFLTDAVAPAVPAAPPVGDEFDSLM